MTADPTLTENELPEQLRQVLQLALDKGARGPVILHVSELAGYTDWVLILSGRSDKHVQGITEGILDGMSKAGLKPLGTDGLSEHTWDLLDFDDFLVHVFYHPVREFYDLESMWNDAPRVQLGLPAEVMDTSDLAGLAPPDPMPGWRGNAEFGGFPDEFREFEAELDDEDDDRALDDEDDELFGTE